MMRGRGRGVRQRGAKTKLGNLPCQGSQEHKGVYEDEAVYVTQGPKTRGRPRRPTYVATVPSQPTPVKHQLLVSNEVIYMTAGRGRPAYVIPSRNLPPPPNRTPQFSLLSTARPDPIRCLVSGITAKPKVVNVLRPVTTMAKSSPVIRMKKEYCPEGPKDVVENCENRQDREIKDVVSWLMAPVNTVQQPTAVQKIQSMWTSMPETWEEKVDLAIEWLHDSDSSKTVIGAQQTVNSAQQYVNAGQQLMTSAQHPVYASSMNSVAAKLNGETSPSIAYLSTFSSVESKLKSAGLLPVSKVLVETQPKYIQDCNQWSSMSDSA